MILRRAIAAAAVVAISATNVAADMSIKDGTGAPQTLHTIDSSNTGATLCGGGIKCSASVSIDFNGAPLFTSSNPGFETVTNTGFIANAGTNLNTSLLATDAHLTALGTGALATDAHLTALGTSALGTDAHLTSFTSANHTDLNSIITNTAESTTSPCASSTTSGCTISAIAQAIFAQMVTLNSTSAAPLPAGSVVGITDGTNVASVKAASTLAATTDKSVVVQINPLQSPPVKITDGTNTAAVKPASTAAATTDPAVVVAISPNGGGKVALDQTTVGTSNGVSLAQVGATTVATGSGAVGNGSQRIAVGTDSATVAGSGPGTNLEARNVTPTNCSSTITTGGTAQSAIAAQTTLHGFTIANIDSTTGSGEPLWISLTTTAAASTTASYPLAAPATTTFAGMGTYTTPPGFGVNHAISIIGATTGHKFSCTWW